VGWKDSVNFTRQELAVRAASLAVIISDFDGRKSQRQFRAN